MIRFENISKHYGDHEVVSDISFEINQGELVVLIGPSGCGKTTLLKIINRLITPTAGDVLINNESIYKQDKIELRRNIGYVIQQTGIFPHLTVKENIEIIPLLQKRNKKAIKAKTLELMQMVGLDPDLYLDRYPSQLSGGQQQRIGVARAFACDPDIILMDEPFSALDPLTRVQLQEELVKLQATLKKTIVFVTHDMDEAVKIADRICIINEGKILQYDTTENIMKQPATEFVQEFVGKHRIWSSPALIRATDIIHDLPATVKQDATINQGLTLLEQMEVDLLMIVDDGNHLMGMTTLHDLKNVKDKQELIVKMMNQNPITVYQHENIISILRTLKAEGMHSVPVINKERELKGLISNGSLLVALSQQYLTQPEVK
jgi:osmoprotectant transport system ATP-binding protein